MRWYLFALFIFMLLLGGCSSGVFRYAYTASDGGVDAKDLQQDNQFSTTDDFNVVVKLMRHSQTLQMSARFTDPNGDILDEIKTDVSPDIETVVMGIDYDARRDQVNQWRKGRYEVKVMINGEVVETLVLRLD